MASFAWIAATRGVQDREEAAETRRLHDRAGGAMRDVNYRSDSESSEEEQGNDDDEGEQNNHRDSGLPMSFLGSTISYDDRPQLCMGNFFGTAICYDRHPQRHMALHVDTRRSETHERQPSSNEEAPQRPNNEFESEEGPPTPWGSSSAKRTIIAELKNEASDIHLLIGHYTSGDFSKVNFTQILQQYAGNKYKKSNFRANLIRLLKHYLAKTGPFKPEQVEPWYTSAKNVSKAYSMLFALYMDPKDSRKVRGMSAEQIWRSHPQFQLYDLEKFKTHNKDMKALTDKRKALISDEEACYRRDMLKLPRSDKSSRGIPFWHTHAASELLREHVSLEMDGTIKKIKPQQLWKSREEYKEFPLKIFRKHVYQERTKQLAAPYWQHKRNKSARKKYEETEELLKEWNEEQINREVGGLIGAWDGIDIRDD